MNHLFWFWVGGVVVTLSVTTIATGVYHLKTASLREVLFELVSIAFWPLVLPIIYFQQNSIRKEMLHRAGACPCGDRCKDCETFRRDLQRQWLERHRDCPACHPTE